MTRYHFTQDEQIILYWFLKARLRKAATFEKFARLQSAKNWNEREAFYADACLSEILVQETQGDFSDEEDIQVTQPDDYVFTLGSSNREWLLKRLAKEPERLKRRCLMVNFAMVERHTENPRHLADYSINGLCKAAYGFTAKWYERAQRRDKPALIYDNVDENDTRKLCAILELLIMKLSIPIEQFWPLKGYDHVPAKHNLVKDSLGNWIKRDSLAPRTGSEALSMIHAPIGWL